MFKFDRRDLSEGVECGSGTWIYKVSKDGWLVQQAELYHDTVLIAPDDINFANSKIPKGLEDYVKNHEEISKETFEDLCSVTIFRC
jgi:hypothetical protein